MKVAIESLTARELSYNLHEAGYFGVRSKRITRANAKKMATRGARRDGKKIIQRELALAA
jgi:hypothetical protein